MVDGRNSATTESSVRKLRLGRSLESGNGRYSNLGKGKMFPGLGVGKVDWSGGKIAYTRLGEGARSGVWEYACRGTGEDDMVRKGSFEPRVNGKGEYWSSPNKAGFF